MEIAGTLLGLFCATNLFAITFFVIRINNLIELKHRTEQIKFELLKKKLNNFTVSNKKTWN